MKCYIQEKQIAIEGFLNQIENEGVMSGGIDNSSGQNCQIRQRSGFLFADRSACLQ